MEIDSSIGSEIVMAATPVALLTTREPDQPHIDLTPQVRCPPHFYQTPPEKVN